jgi:pilus assembly protein CpaC
MAAAFLAGTAAAGWADKVETRGGGEPQLTRDSVLRIPGNAAFPLTKRLGLGVGRSIVVQFPMALKDVLVSDPQFVDAVVQSSDRVFLIAKKPGQTNAFFFDEFGQQILTLEVAVGADLAALDDLLRRLIPGSNIHSEIAGNALILTGSVRTPVDSNRAAQIAAQFAAANKGAVGTVQQGPSASATTTTTTTNTFLAAAPPTISYKPPQGDQGSSSGGGSDDPYAEKAIINLLTVEGEEQVMLRVSVAEVQREMLKQFGINIGALVNNGNFTTAILSENALPLTTAAGLGAFPITGVVGNSLNIFDTAPIPTMPGMGFPSGVIPAAPAFVNSGVATAWTSGNQSIDGALRALERDGLVKLLAEPNLTAVSGEPAKFLAGGEFPVPVVDALGQVTVIFKEFGIGLAFTPVVMSEGRISLKIETEVSELTSEGAVVLNNIQIPALRKRNAKSTVELPSGGSLAIAGLLSEHVRQNIDGFPGLKDLPILGTLFRSRDFRKAETELVVIVTPYTVRPVARQQLARPLDGLGEPSDRKANFLGHINNVYGGGAPAPTGDLKGDYGFIVE